MKRISKSILSLFLIFVIVFSLPTTAFAFGALDLNIESMISIKKVGNKKMYSFDRSKINILKSNKKIQKSSSDCILEVLSEMGFETNEVSQLKKLPRLQQIENIETMETYIKTDINGNVQSIDEATCLGEVAEIKSKEKKLSTYGSTDSSHSGGEWVSENGYMKMQIAAIYTPHYDGQNTTKGRYVFLASCIWLIPPITTMTDALSLGGNGFTWENRFDSVGNDNYSTIISYTSSFSNQVHYVTDTISANSFKKESNGVYFEYNLPDNSILPPLNVRNTDLAFLVSGVATVTDYNNAYQKLSITFRYLHTELAISPSFSWSTAGSCISSSIMKTKHAYDTWYTWDYAGDYFA